MDEQRVADIERFERKFGIDALDVLLGTRYGIEVLTYSEKTDESEWELWMPGSFCLCATNYKLRFVKARSRGELKKGVYANETTRWRVRGTDEPQTATIGEYINDLIPKITEPEPEAESEPEQVERKEEPIEAIEIKEEPKGMEWAEKGRKTSVSESDVTIGLATTHKDGPKDRICITIRNFCKEKIGKAKDLKFGIEGSRLYFAEGGGYGYTMTGTKKDGSAYSCKMGIDAFSENTRIVVGDYDMEYDPTYKLWYVDFGKRL